jgi:hypothetical protein
MRSKNERRSAGKSGARELKHRIRQRQHILSLLMRGFKAGLGPMPKRDSADPAPAQEVAP